jgi:hypothetical protein
MGDDPMALLGLEGALKHYYYYYYYCSTGAALHSAVTVLRAAACAHVVDAMQHSECDLHFSCLAQ